MKKTTNFIFNNVLPIIVNAEICDMNKISIDSITLEEKRNTNICTILINRILISYHTILIV